MSLRRATAVLVTTLLSGCTPSTSIPVRNLPMESYERPAESPHEPTDYIFRTSQMPSFYDVPGEFGHFMGGPEYGFEKLYFILTETHPCGGPPLHTHDTEEAHVLIEGRATYVMGDKQLSVEGPYIARVPAGMPHTFINAGEDPFRLVAVFSGDKSPSYSKVNENPLVSACAQPRGRAQQSVPGDAPASRERP